MPFPFLSVENGSLLPISRMLLVPYPNAKFIGLVDP
jgi:hypothetical protein